VEVGREHDPLDPASVRQAAPSRSSVSAVRGTLTISSTAAGSIGTSGPAQISTGTPQGSGNRSHSSSTRTSREIPLRNHGVTPLGTTQENHPVGCCQRE